MSLKNKEIRKFPSIHAFKYKLRIDRINNPKLLWYTDFRFRIGYIKKATWHVGNLFKVNCLYVYLWRVCAYRVVNHTWKISIGNVAFLWYATLLFSYICIRLCLWEQNNGRFKKIHSAGCLKFHFSLLWFNINKQKSKYAEQCSTVDCLFIFDWNHLFPIGL